MRARSITAVVALALAAGSAAPERAAADCDDPFAHPDQVLDLHLRMSRLDWERLLGSRVTNPDSQPTDSPACAESFPKFQAEFRCGDGAWMDVALRKKKGEERGVEAFEKPPLKIDFDVGGKSTSAPRTTSRFPAAFGALGLGALTLNNGQSNKFSDKTAVLPVLQAEHVALRLLANALEVSPKTAYATVTMHFDDAPQGEYRGVFIAIEDIDRRALQRRGLPGTGRLEKSSTNNCSPELEFDDGSANAATRAFDAFIAKDPAAYAGRWASTATDAVQLEPVLRQEAAREILLNGNDTLFNSQNAPGLGNNWYAYDEPAGTRLYIPWDLDLAFGQQGGSCQPTPLQCPANVPLMTWCTGVPGPYAKTRSRLGLALACHPEITGRYLQTMCSLIRGPLSAEAILRVWNQSFETLAPIVPRERERVWGGIDPLAAPPSAAVIETLGSEHARIAAWIPERIAFVRRELERLGSPCY